MSFTPLPPITIAPITGLQPLPGLEPVTKEVVKDPREHLDTYFGVRNGILGKPVENKNYTKETLTYMTPKKRADQITQIIVDQMQELGFDQFGMFECCAGIGGNTLSFLDNPHIKYVVSYEILPDRRKMLQENVTMYGLSDKVFINDAFQGVPNNYEDHVLYFDPPWLPKEIKGHESTKDQYILHGMEIGGKTLEEWIASCSHCAMIVMRVPPGYRLDPVPGFKITSQLLGRKKNSLLIVAIPESKLKPVTEVTATPTTVSPPTATETSEEAWTRGLRDYIRNELLIKILPNDKARDMMVSDKAMQVWTKVFTHESFNPNVGQNYEELELLGDAVMEVNFIKYLKTRVPSIDRKQLSEAKNLYLSKKFQGQKGLEYGMDKWIRTVVEKNTHMFEDVLEAYFGGLDTVGDMVFKFGAGNGLAYNMIRYIFKDVNFDIERIREIAKGHAKTQIKQNFEKLGWSLQLKGVEQFTENSDGTTTASVSFTPAAIEDLASYGVIITDPTLAVETARSKKLAFKAAYEVALAKLRQMGITDEWIQKVRGDKDVKNPELMPYWSAVNAKLAQEGYTDFILKTIKTSKEGKSVQLIGVKPDGYLTVLATNVRPAENELEGKRQVLAMYAGLE